MANTLGTLLIDVKSDTSKLINGFNRAETAVNKTTKQMGTAIKTLVGAYASLEAVDLAKSYARQADEMTNINSKLKLVTKSAEELIFTQEKLFDISQRTNSSYSNNVDLYQKISFATKELNLEQTKQLKLTELINKELLISGTTADGASTLITQLGQAFSSNFQSVSQEINTLKDQAPSLYQTILAGTGKTAAQFKQLAEDGKLSSEIIINAIISQASATDSNFSKMTVTIDKASQNFSNSAKKIVGEFDRINGISSRVSSSIVEISKSLDSLTTEEITELVKETTSLAKYIAILGGSYLAVNTAIKAYATATATATALTAIFQGGIFGLNGSLVLTAASAKALDKALKFSAIGLAVGGIALLVESFIEGNERAKIMSKSVEQLANSFEVLDLKSRLSDVNKELKDLDDRFKGYNETQKMFYKGAYDLAFREKKQLEASIALIEKRNKAQTETTDTKTVKAITRDDSAILKIMGDELAKFNIELDENVKKLKESGATEKEILKFRETEFKKFNDKRQKEALSTEKEEKKSIEDRQSQYINYYEAIKDNANLWKLEEQKIRQENSLLNEIELNKLVDIKKKAFDKEKQITKESMSGDDWKNYYETIGDYSNAWLIEQGSIYQRYSDLTQEEISKVLEIAQKEFMEKFEKPFEFDINLDGFDTPITNAIKSFDKLSEATKEYNKYIKQSGLTKEQIAKADEKNFTNQLKGYSNIAGAIGGLFEAGTREAATFQVAQTALALIEGTRAVLTAGTGDPYTAIPRMIAMGAMVSSLLSNVGVAFGMNKTSVSSDAFSSMVSNTGTGSVLGDTSKASQSLTNSLSTLEDFAEPQYQTLVSMNEYLKTIASNIGGVTSLLIQQGGFAFGAGATEFNTGYKNNISLSSGLQSLGGTAYALGTMNPVSLVSGAVDKILLGGAFSNVLNGAINSILGGVFGKTSVSQSLTDSGIYFANTLLRVATDEIVGQAYQTISTTVSKKSWFKSSSSTTISTYFEALDQETNRQFSLVLKNLYDTTLIAGEALDSTAEQTAQSLSNFIVSIGKISLIGKTGDQIQETLTSIFGRIGDDIAKTAFPLLTSFQQIGEGMFETLTRVATGIEQSKFFIDRLGFENVSYKDILNTQGDVGFEALAQSIIKADEAVYGLNNGVVQMIDNLDITAEELYSTYLSFSNIRDILVATSQSASNLSSSMIQGAGSISALESGTKSFMENFLSDNERLNIELERLREQFEIAGFAMPQTRQGFIDLINSIDTTTTDGAKAYGRLITLSDSYNDTISEIEDKLSTLIATFSNLGDSVSKTIATLAGANNDSLDATAQIRAFWEKREEIDSLLALNGNLTESQQSRLSTLVNEVNSLATNINSIDTSNTTLTSELISNLTRLEDSLNLEEQILSVNIVGINPNVSLIDGIGYNTTAPTITGVTNNFSTSDSFSTEIKDILATIRDNISTFPQRTYDILDDVVNGNSRVKVETV